MRQGATSGGTAVGPDKSGAVFTLPSDRPEQTSTLPAATHAAMPVPGDRTGAAGQSRASFIPSIAGLLPRGPAMRRTPGLQGA
ncbi:MAG: hypothetical protein ACRYHQ_02830 [Janthinobacterium lividum]